MTKDLPLAVCEVRMSNRPFLLCHTHSQAIIDLADGNGVRLELTALPEPLDQVCRACWAAQPTESQVKIII